MLLRMKVLAETVDSEAMTFQAIGPCSEVPVAELEQITKSLEAGATTRFYRGGPAQGRVVTARVTREGIWAKIQIRPRDGEVWRLVETGAINTVEVQPLPQGVDVFLKSVAATYPASVF